MGRKCRTMTVKDVAKDFRLDWDTVKTLDKENEEATSEVSSSSTSCNWYRRNIYKERHTYRIVVSDLERGRPIWFGGKDRSKRVLIYFTSGLVQRR
ncbi:MAG: hypothetical protein HS132_00830 [Planctomycetia bacterium]|nr:hypothetical protein [Planctomycetia bacterium]